MKNLSLLILILTVFTLSSCKKDPIIPNEEELLTTLIYTLTPSAGGTAVVFKFQDLDGDGGASPILTEGKLQANTSYNGTIEVLNEAVLPIVDISVEILEEAEDHQFFFETNSSLMTLSYEDTDANGNPIGLKTKLNTLNSGTAVLTISLKHKPSKPNNNTIADAGGETDIQVQFDVEIL